VSYFFILAYLAAFCWLVPRIGFIKRSGIHSQVIVVLFLFKILAGFVLGWVSLHFSDSDYWLLNNDGWAEYQLLFRDPGAYFTNLFSSADYPKGYGGMLDSVQSFWNDLKYNIVVKLLSIFNIFSRGNYYINSIFFNVLGFFGHVALYRVFIQIYRGRYNAVIIGCFLLPSLLYFSSAVHKDCIVFTALGILCLALYQSFSRQRLTLKRFTWLCIALATLLLLRNVVFMAVLPAMAAYWLAHYSKWKPLLVFATVYCMSAIIFFNAWRISPSLDFMAILAQKQWYFLQAMDANTAIEINTLKPTISSFAGNIPQALNHTLMRPYLTEHPNFFLIPIAVELFVYQLLFVLFLFFRIRHSATQEGRIFVLFGIFLTLTVFLNIGYIVTNLGSIVRYRSIYLPLLLTPLLAATDWQKLMAFFKLKK
jgi:hypothetical protein